MLYVGESSGKSQGLEMRGDIDPSKHSGLFDGVIKSNEGSETVERLLPSEQTSGRLNLGVRIYNTRDLTG